MIVHWVVIPGIYRMDVQVYGVIQVQVYGVMQVYGVVQVYGVMQVCDVSQVSDLVQVCRMLSLYGSVGIFFSTMEIVTTDLGDPDRIFLYCSP